MAGFLPGGTITDFTVRPQNFAIDQPQQITPYSATSVLNSYRQGQTDAGAQQQTNLLKQVGGIAATSGLGAASQAALAGGNVEMGTKLSALDTERKLQLLKIVGNAADTAKTPEQWNQLGGVMDNIFGPGSMGPYASFDNREAARMLVEHAKMQLIQTGVPGEPGAVQNAAVDLQHPERAPVTMGEPRLPKPPPAVPEYSDSTIDFMARQGLAGQTTIFSNMGRSAGGAQAIARVRNRMVEIANEEGLDPKDVAAAQAELTGYAAGQRTLGSISARSDRATIEARALGDQVKTRSDYVDRTEYPDINKILEAGMTKTGNTNVVRLGIALNGFINTYAKAINPLGVPTDADKNHARDILNAAWSKGQINAAMDQFNIELTTAQGATPSAQKQMHEAFTGGGGSNPQPAPKSMGPIKFDPATKPEDRLLDQVYDFPKGLQLLWTKNGWEKL